MKKITLLLLCLILSISIDAQTVAWSSNSDDFATWGILDSDMDGNNWGLYGPGAFDALGFTGNTFASQSWAGVALTPDNILFTPVFAISGTAVTISFKMKVAASFTPDFAENFAVYIYDNDDLTAGDVFLYEETLTAGGAGTAKDITVTIPVSFAGKNVGMYIRHYDCTNQEYLVVDDFEVSFTTSLSVEENQLSNLKTYPNPTSGVINIDTSLVIDKISIMNQLGQRVLEIKKDNIFNNTINISSLSKGLYLMTVTSENKSKTIKVIKE